MQAVTQRLAEAEATIQALISGQIDAVVNPGTAVPILLFEAQRALQQSEERANRERDRAQHFLDAAEVILLASDLNCNVTLINRYGASVVGWAPSEVIGLSWIDHFIPERMRSEALEGWARIIGGDLSVVEGLILTRTGEERIIEWRSTALADDAGKVIGAFSCGTDVTERNATSRALRRTEERFRFALEAAGVGIWDVNYKTGELSWSDILAAQYGTTPGEVNSIEKFLSYVHEEDRQELEDTISQAKKSGEDFTLAHRAVLADGTIRSLISGGRVLLGGDGKATRAIGISLDVTERRALERHLQQAQKMEAIGRLASGVAHDFNNLLTVILGFSDMLAIEIPPESQQGQDLAEIVKASHRASGLTEQLLAFSRQQVMQTVSLDLNKLIREMSGMLERIIGEKIDVSKNFQSDLPPVSADPGQLEQVIMNLVVNARDAMPDGGALHIRTEIVRLEQTTLPDEIVAEGSFVMLSISDTGTGMTQETQRRLFEPFYTTKEAGKGTGLGLATTYGIVKQSKGHISVHSELGRGTVFKVYLPLSNQKAARRIRQVPATPHTDQQAATILLVEDEQGVRGLAARVLTSAGYRVHQAANGPAAERVFERYGRSIDLMVTDVVMPGVDGPELFARLQLKAPQLKVLYMSGYADQSMVLQAGFGTQNPYLKKPFSSSDLLKHVRVALDQTVEAEVAR